MAEAALLSFEVGFESTTLPFDLNVEAELLGGSIHYHDEVEGHPVYPTSGCRLCHHRGRGGHHDLSPIL